MQSVTVSC